MTRDGVAIALLVGAIVASVLVVGGLIVAAIAAGVLIAQSEHAEMCGGVAILAVLVFGALALTERTL
jgi:hypothetical protein